MEITQTPNTNNQASDPRTLAGQISLRRGLALGEAFKAPDTEAPQEAFNQFANGTPEPKASVTLPAQTQELHINAEPVGGTEQKPTEPPRAA